MFGRRGRTSGNRRRFSNRPRLGRVIKRMAKKGRAKPRPSNTIRGAGSSSCSVKAIRRLYWFPKVVPASGENQGSKWWLETLRLAGKILMVLLTHLLVPAGDEEEVNQNTSATTGCVMRIALGAEDLIHDTPYVFDDDSGTATSRFRHARVDNIKVSVIPAAHLTDRAGLLYVNLVSCERDQVIDDYDNRSNETIPLVELQQQPGVVIGTAVRAKSVSWSAKPDEQAYDWHPLGTQKDRSTRFPFPGGMPVAYLTIGYSDVSANKTTDIAAGYALTEAAFDVVITSTVQLKYGETSVTVRRDPISMLDPTRVVVSDGKRHRLVDDAFKDERGRIRWNPRPPISPFERLEIDEELKRETVE